MKTLPLVAKLLLREESMTFWEISRKVKEIGASDNPGFQATPIGPFNEEIRDFIGRLELLGYISRQCDEKLVLTAEGRILAAGMVAEALLYQELGDKLTKAEYAAIFHPH